ncbi:GNAT family N-acetyltransferase [Demequina subtropica]|uniref:GNAT family N-acetyltransferase n=1 Tax=Demequina subtropica TaxID=1638989 RepID=UPI0007832A5E|nr:GNAT family protein [Demequina subtropica]
MTSDPSRTRLIAVEDAVALAALVAANRAFMAPWDPVRHDEFYSEAGQRAVIAGLLRDHADGRALPHVILADDGTVAGRITLGGIARGPAQSAGMGYWVAQELNGRGLATEAVARIKELAFGPLGLHRIQAETLPHNVASQRVLARNGFERYGYAPRYLRIAGDWQDHVMFQAVHDSWTGPAAV